MNTKYFKSAGRISAEKACRLAADLAEKGRVMCIATMSATGPWTAPVYYVFTDNRFYFFSSPESRHIRDAIGQGEAAASIFSAPESWEGIKGLQMTGKIAKVDSIKTSGKIAKLMAAKYPGISSLLRSKGAGIDPVKIFSSFKVSAYVYFPETVYYTDNRMGFGKRQEVCLDG